MNRTMTWWLLVAALLVFDVVTVVFHLFSPWWQAMLFGFTALVLTGYAVLRWLDWRMRREHSRDAYAALARKRQGREGPAPVR